MLNPMKIFPSSTNYSVTFYDIIMFNSCCTLHDVACWICGLILMYICMFIVTLSWCCNIKKRYTMKRYECLVVFSTIHHKFLEFNCFLYEVFVLKVVCSFSTAENEHCQVDFFGDTPFRCVGGVGILPRTKQDNFCGERQTWKKKTKGCKSLIYYFIK